MTTETSTLYAWVQQGIVREIWTVPPGVALGATVTAAVAAEMVAVPTGVAVAQGWTYSASAGFAAPVAPAPTAAEEALALLAGGLSLTITGSLTLNATFPTDAITQKKLLGVQTVLTATGKFPAGVATWPVRDATGAWHALTPGQFTAIGGAVASFVAQCELVVDGESTTLPSASAAVTTP